MVKFRALMGFVPGGFMRKRAMALWPLAIRLKPEAESPPLQFQPAQEQEQWNQEELKLLNEPRQFESAQEKIQRLMPGFEIKKVIL